MGRYSHHRVIQDRPEKAQLGVVDRPHQKRSVEKQIVLFAACFGDQTARVARREVERVRPLPSTLNTQRIGGTPASHFKSSEKRPPESFRITLALQTAKGSVSTGRRRVDENPQLVLSFVVTADVQFLSQGGARIPTLERELLD